MAEAKWNYAYYLQNEELLIGAKEENLITSWIKKNNLYFTDQKYEQNYKRAIHLSEEITKKFYGLEMEVIKRLHIEGII